MAYSGGTGWGNRNPNAKLFAVRCRFADVSGATFKELSLAAQQVRATMGPVSKIRSKKEGEAREATVYVTGREACEKFLGSAEAIQGVKITSVIDELELHQAWCAADGQPGADPDSRRFAHALHSRRGHGV